MLNVFPRSKVNDIGFSSVGDTTNYLSYIVCTLFVGFVLL